MRGNQNLQYRLIQDVSVVADRDRFLDTLSFVGFAFVKWHQMDFYQEL